MNSPYYPKPRKSEIVASKSEVGFRRFLGVVTSVIALYIMLPAILFTYKEFLVALFTWAVILLIVYCIVNPILKFFKVYIIDKLFDSEEKYRKQIIERLLWFYTYRTDIGWDEAKEYVNYLEEEYPTAVALEAWLES